MIPGRRRFFILLNLLLVVLAGGFAAAALVRFSPGFDIDENAWNPRLSGVTLEAMHRARQRDNVLPLFYLRYLRGAFHGDLGESESLREPVSALLRRRAPVTARLLGWGVSGGLFFGALAAWAAVWPRRVVLEAMAVSSSGFLLAIPPAVLALAFFFEEAPLALAVALALFPRVFGTMRALLDGLFAAPSLLAARARGVGPFTLAIRYVIAAALPQWIALAGVALVLAFGFIIPIEALCDVPGIGQLAWKAALSRDLPLLCGLALIVTFAVACVQSFGELIGRGA